MHNPGTLPDKMMTRLRPDIMTVFEESYARYRSLTPQERKALQRYERRGSCYMMHSVPKGEVKAVTRALKQRAQYIFVTNRSERFYEAFGSSWPDFIDAMTESSVGGDQAKTVT